MSKIKIVGHASGTGVLTIAAPNTNTDRTITIPDVTGTLLDSGSDLPAANLTGTIADARFPATLPAASGANLTALPAANITGTLPAISGANLTGIGPTVATTAPSSPSEGDQWFDTTTGVSAMKVWSGTGWDQLSNKFSATGGTVTTYSSGGINYKVHTFTSSGTFIVQSSGTVEYLVIAGGGSGGGQHGGGGGAGGYRTAPNFPVTATSYTITVGGGGAAISGAANPNTGANGSNSVFSTITSIGGGAGQGWSQGVGTAGFTGGSGGGASLNGPGGAGTAGQGNAGGSSTSSSTFPNGGGGGGGAGSVGGDSINLTRAGNGGSGSASSINGTSVTRAGGGAGGSHAPHAIGTGGSGGGGNGGLGNTSAGINATTNTGSGGGGSGSNTTLSGAGGSGIVIIRYVV